MQRSLEPCPQPEDRVHGQRRGGSMTPVKSGADLNQPALNRT
jgi:hypothetical protein